MMKPQPSHNPFSNLLARTVLLYGGIIMPLLVGLGLGGLGGVIKIDPKNPSVSLILYILIMVGLCGWLLHRFKQLRINWRHVMGRIPQRYAWGRTIALVPVLVLFSVGAFWLSVDLLSWLFPAVGKAMVESAQSGPDLHTSTSWLYQILLSFVLIVVAPVTEELVFRGVLLQRWAVKWGTRSGLIVSSLLFGLLHLNVVGLSMFGLVMGLLYLKTRTLWIPIACHALNNSIVVLLMLLPHAPPSETTANQVVPLNQSLGLALLLMIVSVPWLFWFIQRYLPHQNTPIPYVSNAN
jgi:uncharacterized protein